MAKRPEAALKLAEESNAQYIEDLRDLLRIPSISTDPAYEEEVRRAAEWVAKACETAGLEKVRIIDTKGHPLVYAEWLQASGAPTVLVYGHYDVQPAEPLEEWTRPPFDPTVEGEHLYARGASDDKGQVMVQLKALESIMRTDGAFPLNIKVILEGEEETGGESIEAFIPENRELLAADLAVVSDTSIIDAATPAIVYGLRGMVYAYLDVTGPGRDLHSGVFGGAVDNPINAAAHIIAALKDEAGAVQIPGFYERVRDLSSEEREAISRRPMTEAGWLAETGAPEVWGEPGFTLLERIGARPTLDVNGIRGGYTGEGAKTVLPSSVHCKISMRLVPDQDPDEIFRLLEAYVESVTPSSVTARLTLVHKAPATITDINEPGIASAQYAYREAFGAEPILMREGGSIPVVGEFQRHLGIQTVLMGFGLPDDRLHAPNERLFLPNFRRGVETMIRFYYDLAERRGVR